MLLAFFIVCRDVACFVSLDFTKNFVRIARDEPGNRGREKES